MKNDQIQIGNTYTAKVTNKVVPVRIDAEHTSGGWTATNLITNKKVRIKSAQRLREEVTASTDAAPTRRRVKKKLSAAERAQRQRKTADQENAHSRDARADTTDGESGPKKSNGIAKPDKPKKLSLLDAAVQVLATSDEPLNTKQLVEQVTEQGLWQPGAGKTPAATLYSAILRELKTKGDESRFTKVERGKFAVASETKMGA